MVLSATFKTKKSRAVSSSSRRASPNSAKQQLREIERPLQAAAHVLETPPIVARHVFRCQPVQDAT